MNKPNIMTLYRTRRISFTLALISLIILVARSEEAVTQEQGHTTQMVVNPEGLSVPELLERFADRRRQFLLNTRVQRDIGAILSQRHVAHPEAQVDSLLDGLERMVLESGNPEVRGGAANLFARPGLPGSPNPRVDMPERIERLYRSSTDAYVQEILLTDLPRLHDRSAAVRIARRIALEAPQEQALDGAAGFAIYLLAGMDEEGRQVLRELHAGPPLPDPAAERLLEAYAQRDFRRPPPPAHRPDR